MKKTDVGAPGQGARRDPAEIEKRFIAKVRPPSLLQRFETPKEVAAVVAFVASTRPVTINGPAVRAEGGVVRSIF